jgi:hypothetical protein
MAATAIDKADRFFAPEITKIVFIPEPVTPATFDKSEPTRVQIDAGKELMNEVSAVNGFNVSSNMIDAPDYGSRFTSQTPGRTSVADSSLVFYQSRDTHDIREVLPRGTKGFVLIMWGGDVPDQLMDVFPVEVTSAGKSIPDNADSDITVMFAITSEPAEDVAIPAAAGG